MLRGVTCALVFHFAIETFNSREKHETRGGEVLSVVRIVQPNSSITLIIELRSVK